MHGVALPRRIVGRMAIEAARTQNHLARLLEQRHRARLFVLDLVELLDRRQGRLRLCKGSITVHQLISRKGR